MRATLLDPRDEAQLRAAPFTYASVGRSAGTPPSGYSTFRKTRRLSHHDFEAACAALFGWEVQTRSGIRVAASSLRVVPDAVVRMRVGAGRLGLTAPCRVVYVIKEPRRRGFAYGTLPGHPESGEEAFSLVLGDDDTITFTVNAFSRPSTALARLGGPVARAVQSAITGRYLDALDRRLECE